MKPRNAQEQRRDDARAGADRARAAAKRRYPDATVSPYAHVQPCLDGGMFVEIIVFIAEEDL